MLKKILICFGTRPEAIKMASLVKEFENHQSEFDVKVCITGQHREMLNQVLKIFDIKPDYDLNIMKSNQTLFDVTSNILLGMNSVLDDFNPDLVMVHGDTTTTLSVSLSAYYKKIKVAHVEAGLRTNDIYSPWPEEANRQLTSVITNYHFAPTILNKQNLLKENKNKKYIWVTGNTVIDSLYLTINNINTNLVLKEQIINNIKKSGYKIGRKMILITGHRRENHGQGFIDICNAISNLAKEYPDFDFVYPVHLNPNVQKPVNDILVNLKNVFLIEPQSYLEFVYLMDNSYLILTDSGGVQEEAPSLRKPVVVMRDKTERLEAVEKGTVILVGSDKDKIFNTVKKLIENEEFYKEMANQSNPYGNGESAKKIIKILKKEL